MKPVNFCVIVVALAVCGFVSLLLGGSPSGGLAAPTLEGGPTYVNGSGPAASLQGTPLPAPQTSTASLFSSGSAGTNPSSGGGPQTTVPGGNNYGGTNDAATNAPHERGVAGSGLPREKVSVVDTKTLPTTKSDGKFSGSLLDAGLKADTNEKSQDKNNVSSGNDKRKQQSSSNKAGDNSSESAKTVSAAKTDGNH